MSTKGPFYVSAIGYTMIMQREDLESQRKELKEQQNKSDLQNFQNTFFNLLNLHNEMLSNFLSIDNKIEVYKKLAIEQLLKGFTYIYSFGIVYGNNHENTNYINEKYEAYYNEHPEFGCYFRNLYYLIDYVDKSTLEINKEFYINTIKAQLSRGELVFLFYNCLSDRGKTYFKPLVEKYGLLEGIQEKDLFNKIHLWMYESTAYGNNKNLLYQYFEEKPREATENV